MYRLINTEMKIPKTERYGSFSVHSLLLYARAIGILLTTGAKKSRRKTILSSIMVQHLLTPGLH